MYIAVGILTMKLDGRIVPALKTQYTRKALVALRWGIYSAWDNLDYTLVKCSALWASGSEPTGQ